MIRREKNRYAESEAIALFRDSRTLQRRRRKKEAEKAIRRYERVFDIREGKMMVLVGDFGSGINEYAEKKFSNGPIFFLRASNFQNEMAYRTIVGAAPGYIGSEKPTKFIRFLHENPSATVVIKGLSGIDPGLFQEFVESFIEGEIADHTEKIGKVSTRQARLVILHYSTWPDADSSSEDHLKSKLALEETLNRGQTVRIFDPALLDHFRVSLFDSFYDRPERLDRLADEIGKEKVQLLKRVSREFQLENENVLKLADKKIEIKPSGVKLKLIVDGETAHERLVFNEQTFLRFNLLLAEKYFGQEMAQAAFKRALAAKVRGLSQRPYSIFCVGPPGIGKTEIAKLLGKAVGNFVRIDANQITSIEKLFGSDREIGLLFRGLERNSAAVVLIDEIEKAPVDVILSLLQILDEGRATDLHTNKTYHFNDVIFVFTSNAIREEVSSEIEARELLKERGFPQEFVDRINQIATFRRFSFEEKLELFQKFSKMKEVPPETREKIKQIDSIRQLKLEAERIQAEQSRNELEQEVLLKLSQEYPEVAKKLSNHSASLIAEKEKKADLFSRLLEKRQKRPLKP